jgi:hypothetical protein
MGVGSPQAVHQGSGEECAHAGYHSGVGLYCRDSRTLRYVLVCDDCGAEIKEVSTLEYTPRPVFATG